jgi:hypothetical protein
MEAERQIYRTTLINGEATDYADCTLTDQRLVIRWHNAGFDQYSLRTIEAVWTEDMPRSLRKRFRGKADPATVRIDLASGRTVWLHAASGQLAAQIQRALRPF